MKLPPKSDTCMKPFKSLLIVVADTKFVNKSWACLIRKIEKYKFPNLQFGGLCYFPHLYRCFILTKQSSLYVDMGIYGYFMYFPRWPCYY